MAGIKQKEKTEKKRSGKGVFIQNVAGTTKSKKIRRNQGKKEKN